MKSKPELKYRGKIAFCFLMVSNIKNINAWRKFFQGYEQYYNMYCHISGQKYDQKDYWDPEAWNNRVEVYGVKHTDTKWGTVSLVRAEGLIYKAAIKDKENKYFCMLSESEIPLWTFPEFYNMLTIKLQRTGKSYLTYSSLRGVDEDIFTECFPERFIPSSNKARSRSKRDRRKWTTWSSHQWKILNRRDAKEFLRMCNNEVYMKSYENCFKLEADRLAPDEYMFSNWISLKYGPNDLKKRFYNEETTFVSFDEKHPEHALEYDDIDEDLKETFCYYKPYFARKFKVDAKGVNKLPIKCD